MNDIRQRGVASSAVRAFADAYLEQLHRVLSQIDRGQIAAFVAELIDARARGAAIYFIGNGGSAATASHFANDMAVSSRNSGRPFRAISLTDNVATMTCIANDFGYDQVFVRQLASVSRSGDVLVAISASGNSPNILRAVEFARDKGLRVVGLSGFDGGRLRELADVCVHVPTATGQYGPVEDAHMVLDHLVGAYLANQCREESGS